MKRVWRAFQWERRRTCGVLPPRPPRGGGCLVLALALAASVPACRDHQLSGKELQSRKVETLRQNDGKLTAEEEFQIRTIHARTDSEYDRAVSRILATRKAAPKQPPGTASETVNQKPGKTN